MAWDTASARTLLCGVGTVPGKSGQQTVLMSSAYPQEMSNKEKAARSCAWEKVPLPPNQCKVLTSVCIFLKRGVRIEGRNRQKTEDKSQECFQ